MATKRYNGKSLRTRSRDLSQIRRVYYGRCRILSRGIISRARNSLAFAPAINTLDGSPQRPKSYKHPYILCAIFDFRSVKRANKIRFSRCVLKRKFLSRRDLMGFQESLGIACLSRKMHGFDKKDCTSRGGRRSREFL